MLPMTFGYSIFLCCQLGECPSSEIRDCERPADSVVSVALVSGVDSKVMVSDQCLTFASTAYWT